MTLYLFKYCLPVLLGYILFIGLAGRLNPFVKPEFPEERPSWFLGVWFGLSITLVIGVGMHMAYSISLESAKALLLPVAFFMGVLLLPGLAGYSLYRRHVTHKLRELVFEQTPEHSPHKQALKDDLMKRGNNAQTQQSNITSTESSTAAATHSQTTTESSQQEDPHAPIVASFLHSAQLQVMDTRDYPAANGEPIETFEAFLGSDLDYDSTLDETVFEGFHYSDLDLDSSELDATQLINSSELADIRDASPSDSEYQDLTLFNETKFSLPTTRMDCKQNRFAKKFEHNDSTEIDANQNGESLPHTCNECELSLSKPNQQGTAKYATDTDSSYATSASKLQLEQRLSEELAAHEETSRQLRITRKVLARLTPSAQDNSPWQAIDAEDNDSLTRLKDELAASLAAQESHLSAASAEKEKRLRSDETCAQLRQELIQAKHDIRQSSAARATALSTANKAIAFARQTVQIRALLEEELQLAKSTLSKRQNTISSVIRELENEKAKTQEEVALLAQQMIEQTQQAKRPCNDELKHDKLTCAAPATSNGKTTES